MNDHNCCGSFLLWSPRFTHLIDTPGTRASACEGYFSLCDTMFAKGAKTL